MPTYREVLHSIRALDAKDHYELQLLDYVVAQDQTDVAWEFQTARKTEIFDRLVQHIGLEAAAAYRDHQEVSTSAFDFLQWKKMRTLLPSRVHQIRAAISHLKSL